MSRNFKLAATVGILLFTASASAHTCKYDSIESTAPAERFIAQDDGTVLDASTGLSWMACTYGTRYTGGGCSGTPTNFPTWSEALKLTETVRDEGFAGYDDWRLPNIKELASIIEYACFAPAITVEVFPDTPSAAFWSNTPDSRGVNPGLLGRIVDFTYGVEDFNSAGVSSDRVYVRMVRDTN